MATITKSIGTDVTRDYSTITGWEAALGGAAGGAGNDAVGEMYNDSAFDEEVVINDITPDSIVLSVASGERHDGTAGSGARIVLSFGGSGEAAVQIAADLPVVVEWIEVDGNNAGQITDGFRCFNGSTTNTGTFKQCIAHDIDANNADLAAFNGDSGLTNILNCIGYDVISTNGLGYGCEESTGVTVNYLNNTMHNNKTAGFNGANVVQNCIGTDNGTDFTGSPSTEDHNISSDTTASGTGSLISKTAANQFVSLSPVDLHLKSGADAIDAGTDLGTTPTGVNIDIDGRDRDSEGDTWDIGAHEFVSGGSPTLLPTNLNIINSFKLLQKEKI